MKSYKNYRLINLMKFKFILLILLFTSCNKSNLDGNVYDYDTEKPLKNVFVNINGNTTQTDSNGYFRIKVKVNSKYIILLKKEGYALKKIYREPDSLNEFSKKKLKNNKIYLIDKDTDFTK